MTAKQLQAFMVAQDFCDRSVRWAKGRTFAEAWKACPYGSWLAFYLFYVRAVSNTDLGVLATQCGVPLTFYVGSTRPSRAQRAYADEIRRRYTRDGNPRT